MNQQQAIDQPLNTAERLVQKLIIGYEILLREYEVDIEREDKYTTVFLYHSPIRKIVPAEKERALMRIF